MNDQAQACDTSKCRHEVNSKYYIIGGKRRMVMSDVDYSGNRIVMSATIDTLGVSSVGSFVAEDKVDIFSGKSFFSNDVSSIADESKTDVQSEDEEVSVDSDVLISARVDNSDKDCTETEDVGDIVSFETEDVTMRADDSVFMDQGKNKSLDPEDDNDVINEDIVAVAQYLSEKCGLDNDEKSSVREVFDTIIKDNSLSNNAVSEDSKDKEFRRLAFEEIGKAVSIDGETVTEDNVKEFRDKLNKEIDDIIKDNTISDSNIDDVISDMIKDGYIPDIKHSDQMNEDKSDDVFMRKSDEDIVSDIKQSDDGVIDHTSNQEDDSHVDGGVDWATKEEYENVMIGQSDTTDDVNVFEADDTYTREDVTFTDEDTNIFETDDVYANKDVPFIDEDAAVSEKDDVYTQDVVTFVDEDANVSEDDDVYPKMVNNETLCELLVEYASENKLKVILGAIATCLTLICLFKGRKR